MYSLYKLIFASSVCLFGEKIWLILQSNTIIQNIKEYLNGNLITVFLSEIFYTHIMHSVIVLFCVIMLNDFFMLLFYIAINFLSVFKENFSGLPHPNLKPPLENLSKYLKSYIHDNLFLHTISSIFFVFIKFKQFVNM